MLPRGKAKHSDSQGRKCGGVAVQTSRIMCAWASGPEILNKWIENGAWHSIFLKLLISRIAGLGGLESAFETPLKFKKYYLSNKMFIFITHDDHCHSNCLFPSLGGQFYNSYWGHCLFFSRLVNGYLACAGTCVFQNQTH